MAEGRHPSSTAITVGGDSSDVNLRISSITCTITRLIEIMGCVRLPSATYIRLPSATYDRLVLAP